LYKALLPEPLPLQNPNLQITLQKGTTLDSR
jgi:hypothetical protein